MSLASRNAVEALHIMHEDLVRKDSNESNSPSSPDSGVGSKIQNKPLL